jgi:signal transduction histidine kinase
MRPLHRQAIRYGFAATAALGAVGCSAAIPFLMARPFAASVFVTVLVAFLAGFGPAIFSTLFSALLVPGWAMLASGSSHFPLRGFQFFAFFAYSALIAALALYRIRADAARDAARDEAAEAIAASERRLQLALRAAHAGVWETDVITGAGFWASSAPLVLATVDGGRSLNWLQLVHPEDRDWLYASYLAACEQPTREWSAECRILQSDGTIRWIATRGEFLSGPDGHTKLLGVAQDITDRKAGEERLRRSEKLAAAGRLASTIAHEINNPLEAIHNLVFLARAHATHPEQKRYLDLAQQELNRVGHIARQTLGFYRESVTPTRFKVAQVVDGVLRLYDRRIASRAIQVLTEGDEHAELTAQQGEFTQVLSNLILNAIEVLPSGGRLRLRWKRVGQRIWLSVGDTGTGISAETKKRLFQPFFTTKEHVGTGLGLFVSKGIVEKNGGTLRVRSRTGRNSGTVFTLSLPVVENQPAAERDGQKLQTELA